MITDYTNPQNQNEPQQESSLHSHNAESNQDNLESKAVKALGSLSSSSDDSLSNVETLTNEKGFYKLRGLAKFDFNLEPDAFHQYNHGRYIFNNLITEIPDEAKHNITAYPLEDFEHYFERMKLIIPNKIAFSGYRDIIRKHWYVCHDMYCELEDYTLIYGPAINEPYASFRNRLDSRLRSIQFDKKFGTTPKFSNDLSKYLIKHNIKIDSPRHYVKPWLLFGITPAGKLQNDSYDKFIAQCYEPSNSSDLLLDLIDDDQNFDLDSISDVESIAEVQPITDLELKAWADSFEIDIKPCSNFESVTELKPIDDFVLDDWGNDDEFKLSDLDESEAASEIDSAESDAVHAPDIQELASERTRDLQDLNWSFVAGVVVGVAATGLLISKLFSKK